MRCPYCRTDNDRVVDSRASGEGFVIRRRRECLECNRRFTTYERLEGTPLRVIKKDGNRVPFERGKILNGCLKACEKQPISVEDLESLVDRIEAELLEKYEKELASSEIGNLVMRELKRLNQVAYVRFASVYRDFKDVNEFMEELRNMMQEKVSVEKPRE